MSRTSITIVVVVLLCAAGYAYSQGWFDWSRPGTRSRATRSAPTRAVEQENTTENATQATEPCTATKE